MVGTVDHPVADRRALPVVGLGVLVAVAPVAVAPFPGDGGPVTVAIRFLQTVGVVVGAGVAVAGYYSYRTGDLRPAMAVGLATVGLVALGAVAAAVEATSGRLVPVWAWLLAASVVIGFSAAWAFRPPPPDTPPPREE